MREDVDGLVDEFWDGEACEVCEEAEKNAPDERVLGHIQENARNKKKRAKLLLLVRG